MMDKIKGCLEGVLAVTITIGGLLLLSFLHKSCVGLLARMTPDSGKYAVTDDYDYYHRPYCACVNEDNFADYLDLEQVREEGLKPCPYCKPKIEE